MSGKPSAPSDSRTPSQLSPDDRIALVEAIERREAGAVRKAAGIAWLSVATAAALLSVIVFGAWSQLQRIRGGGRDPCSSSKRRSRSERQAAGRQRASRRRVPRQAGGAFDANRRCAPDRRAGTRRPGKRTRCRSGRNHPGPARLRAHSRQRGSPLGHQPGRSATACRGHSGGDRTHPQGRSI